MKECIKYRQWIWLALYDELPGDQKKVLEAHIKNCAECQLDYEEAEKAVKLLDQKIQVEPTQVQLDTNRSELHQRLLFLTQSRFQKGWTAKYHSSHLNATFGLARYSEVFINIIPYQDDQRHIWGGFGDTRLGIKYLMPFKTDAFKFGLFGFYKFPTANTSNVRYEIFSTNRPGWCINALFTFDFF